MDIYYVTANFITLSDSFTNSDGKKVYRCKEECMIKSHKAFSDYLEASKYARNILEYENSKYGDERISKDDMDLWDVFFIGFHHGCKVDLDETDEIKEWYKKRGIDEQRLLEIKIETLKLDL